MDGAPVFCNAERLPLWGSWREAPERATHAENTAIRADFIYILWIFW